MTWAVELYGPAYFSKVELIRKSADTERRFGFSINRNSVTEDGFSALAGYYTLALHPSTAP